MRTVLSLVALLIGALGAVRALDAQSGPITSNPLPAPVIKRGITVDIRDVVRLPDTRGMRPAEEDVVPAGWARINYVRELPDGRRFVNDSRGLLYVLDRSNKASVYANVAAAFPLAIYNPLESGFIGFVSPPDSARKGFFYPVQGERPTGNPRVPTFTPPGFPRGDAAAQNVITEWHTPTPAANAFEGT